MAEVIRLRTKETKKVRRRHNLVARRRVLELRANGYHPEITETIPARHLLLAALERHKVSTAYANDAQLLAPIYKSFAISGILFVKLTMAERFRVLSSILDSMDAGTFAITGRKLPNRKKIAGFSKRSMATSGLTTSVDGVDVRSDDFLMTYAWRSLRYEILRKFGARCQCCGTTPANGAVINIDHIKSRRLFPELALTADNLQVLCNACNHGKGNVDQTDWRR